MQNTQPFEWETRVMSVEEMRAVVEEMNQRARQFVGAMPDEFMREWGSAMNAFDQAMGNPE